MRFTVTNGFTIGGVNGNPGNTATGPNPQFGDDLSVVKGAHQLQFGGNYIFQLMNYWSGLNATGSGTLSGNTSGTGLAMADFLTAAGNGAYGWVQGNIYGFTLRQNYFALYAQDSWKMKHNLTVSYGVRYEPYLAVYSKYGQFMHFDPAQFTAGVRSQVFVNAPAGLTFPGDPSYTPGRKRREQPMAEVRASSWRRFGIRREMERCHPQRLWHLQRSRVGLQSELHRAGSALRRQHHGQQSHPRKSLDHAGRRQSFPDRRQ